MPNDDAPRSDDWLEADTWASWWLAHVVIAERVKAGEPLPDIFRPRERSEKKMEGTNA